MKYKTLDSFVQKQPILKGTHKIDLKSATVVLFVKTLHDNGKLLFVLYLLTYASNEWRIDKITTVPRSKALDYKWFADDWIEYSRVTTGIIAAAKHELCEYVTTLDDRGRDIKSSISLNIAIAEICAYVEENKGKPGIFTYTKNNNTYYCVEQSNDVLQSICDELDLGCTGNDIIEDYNSHHGFDLASEGRRTYRPTGGKRVYAFRLHSEGGR